MLSYAGHCSISLTTALPAKSSRHRVCLDEENPFFPFSPYFHLIAATIATSFSGRSKFLQLPFRSPPSTSLPSTALPGCAVLGNTTRLRRRRLPAVGKPAPLLPILPVCLGWKERRKEETEEEEEKENGLTESIIFGWQPVVFRGSDNQVAYLGFICVGASCFVDPRFLEDVAVVSSVREQELKSF
ncbi:uncharacterized protein LOC127753029 isoform X2 [Oryza glaberrima]|uniref:uncharacterized protein LOC127753029 isoform X2 n=1 Tax=Oryza glaberrima TaxID=4538 RepID=UPI00224C52FF|nr:uncharacterized protein LOC127753029 isoform X2 [Oryza glaberrima]